MQQKKSRRAGAKYWIHAELLILDYFWARNLNFKGEERFIGCSKAACYCCYHYIRSHRGRFETRASSNNCYSTWTPPVHDARRPDLVEARERVLIEMTKRMQIDILCQVRNKQGIREYKPDSLTEISSLSPDLFEESDLGSTHDGDNSDWIDQGDESLYSEADPTGEYYD